MEPDQAPPEPPPLDPPWDNNEVQLLADEFFDGNAGAAQNELDAAWQQFEDDVVAGNDPGERLRTIANWISGYRQMPDDEEDDNAPVHEGALPNMAATVNNAANAVGLADIL